MTRREEAIETLKENLCAMCAYGSQDMDSCDIRSCDNKDAIKALEQEPCDDAINRQAALRQAINAHKMAQENGFDFKDICEEYLNVLPPITPQTKTGRWIDDKCSACGKGIEDLIESSEWYQNENPKFCPFCGIKIKEVEE